MEQLKAVDRMIRVGVKVKRAKKHLAEFDRLASEFQGKDAQIAVIENFNPEARFQFSGRAPDIRTYPVAPFEILAVAGDVIQNLRSALDHLAFQLAEVNGHGSDQTAFPIGKSAQDYESIKTRKVNGISSTAVELIDSLKPYKGGNDALWRLHYLSNLDKHRFLLTIDQDYLFTGDDFEGYYWLKTSDPAFRGLSHTQTNDEINFSLEKTLGQSKVPEGEPILPFLHQITKFVTNLIFSFEPLLG